VRNLEAFTTVWNSGLSQPCSGAFESNLTCWQVYQPPGLDSRGLYPRGQSPLADEPGDPLRAVAAPPPALALTSEPPTPESGREAPADLARILYAPLSASTAQGGTP
jgi:hypothetical protein